MLRRLFPYILTFASSTVSAQADLSERSFNPASGRFFEIQAVRQRMNRDTTSATEPRGDSNRRQQRPRWLSPDRMVVTAGRSFANPESAWLGRTPDRDVYSSTVRFAWSTGQDAIFNASYAVDFHPLVAVPHNPARFIDATHCPGTYATPDGPGYVEEFGKCAMHRTAYATGVSPIGLVLQRQLVGRLSAGAELTIGGLLFTDRMPYPNGSKFNYFLGAGAALEIALSAKTAAVVRYRLDHISNAGMGEFIPGLGAHTIHLGVSRAFRAKPFGRSTS